MPPNMLCWQKPLRLGKDGKYFAASPMDQQGGEEESDQVVDLRRFRVEFMRFENVDDNPEVKDLKISCVRGEREGGSPCRFPGHPEVSVCQEPTVVKLPDGRLFCVMRTSRAARSGA